MQYVFSVHIFVLLSIVSNVFYKICAPLTLLLLLFKMARCGMVMNMWRFYSQWGLRGFVRWCEDEEETGSFFGSFAVGGGDRLRRVAVPQFVSLLALVIAPPPTCQQCFASSSSCFWSFLFLSEDSRKLLLDVALPFTHFWRAGKTDYGPRSRDRL